MDAETLQLLEPIFGISVKESEIEIFKNYSRRCPSTEENSDLGLAEVFALCDKDIFPSVHNVLQLFLTVSQTSVTVDRLFSTVKRIKTRLRSLVTSLCLIPCEKDRVRTIDRQRILTHFKNREDYCNYRMRRNFWPLTNCKFCMLLELFVVLKKMLKFKIKVYQTYFYWIIHWSR